MPKSKNSINHFFNGCGMCLDIIYIADVHLWVINGMDHFVSHWINDRRNMITWICTLIAKSVLGAYWGWSSSVVIACFFSLHFSFILTFTENGFPAQSKKIDRSSFSAFGQIEKWNENAVIFPKMIRSRLRWSRCLPNILDFFFRSKNEWTNELLGQVWDRYIYIFRHICRLSFQSL